MRRATIRVAYLAWWGSIEGGGETIGDLYALRRVAKLVAAHCDEIVILSKVVYDELRDVAVVRAEWNSLAPHWQDALIFVCGPVIRGSSSFRALISVFRDCRKIGIGVSVLPSSSADFWQPFDQLVARDGIAGAVGDLAFSSRASRYDTTGPLGICLRGAQREYGAGNCLDVQAAELVKLAIERSRRSHLYLDTRLHGDPAAAERIVHTFASCSVVLSTRLHGCLLALSLGIPFIAVDQIKGGAKVLSEASRLGWRAAWGADDTSAERFLMDWTSALETLRRAVPIASDIADSGLIEAERAIVSVLCSDQPGGR